MNGFSMPPVSASIAVSCTMSKLRWALASVSLELTALGIEDRHHEVERDADRDHRPRITGRGI